MPPSSHGREAPQRQAEERRRLPKNGECRRPIARWNGAGEGFRRKAKRGEDNQVEEIGEAKPERDPAEIDADRSYLAV
jgi:hypothetical protein